MIGSDILIVLVIVLVVVLIWRGPKTLPKWGSTLGRGVREARAEAAKVQTEIQTRTSSPEEPETPPTTGDRPS